MPLRSHRKALAFIFVTVLIDTIGFGIIIPVLPELVMELTGKGLADAARIGGWLMFAYAAMQFICAPIVGGLSDRFGRRPVLLASLFAFAADYAIAAFAPTLAWLVIARLVAGITGASFTTAYAYIADVTPREARAASFATIGLGFGLGFMIGPAIGGLVADWGIRAPFFVAAALALANAAYGYFILPESLPPERRRPFDGRRANPLGSLLHLREQQPFVLILAFAVFAWMLGHLSLQSTWNYYTIFRFGWSEAQVGWSLAAVGLASVIVQGGLARPLIERFGERRLIVIGGICAVAGYLTYAAASSGWMMYVGIAVFALSGMVYPSLQGLMSSVVDERSQGELQGAISSLSSIAAVIGPPLMTQTFAAFSEPGAPLHLPGAPFLLGALFAATTLWLFARAIRRPLVAVA